METKNSNSQLQIGSTLFYVCWILAIVLVLLTLTCDLKPLESNLNFILFLLLIGIILLPFLKSLNIGKIFGVELKNLSSNIEKLRETVLNLNIRSTQEVRLTNVNAPDGQNLQIQTVEQSQKKLNLAYSLLKQKRFLEALDVYHEALKLDPNNWIAAMYLGYLYLSLRDFQVDSNTWGFDDAERLARSMFYSTYATEVDLNHYTQFMNLAIAQKHLGGDGLTRLALKNMEIAYNMLDYDRNVPKYPPMLMNKGKARSFMGEFAEALGLISEAKMYRKEAIEIFKNCPEPKPQDLEKWLKQAEKSLSDLK